MSNEELSALRLCVHDLGFVHRQEHTSIYIIQFFHTNCLINSCFKLCSFKIYGICYLIYSYLYSYMKFLLYIILYITYMPCIFYNHTQSGSLTQHHVLILLVNNDISIVTLLISRIYVNMYFCTPSFRLATAQSVPKRFPCQVSSMPTIGSEM